MIKFSLVSGYGSSTGTWDGYPQYLNTDGMHIVSPVSSIFTMQYFCYPSELDLILFSYLTV